MDLYPLSEETQQALAELRALIAQAPAEDKAYLEDPANELQLQESDLLRYIKVRGADDALWSFRPFLKKK